MFSAQAEEFVRRFPLQVLLDAFGMKPDSADPRHAEIAALLWAADAAMALTPQGAVAAAAERLLILVDRLTGLVQSPPTIRSPPSRSGHRSRSPTLGRPSYWDASYTTCRKSKPKAAASAAQPATVMMRSRTRRSASQPSTAPEARRMSGLAARPAPKPTPASAATGRR